MTTRMISAIHGKATCRTNCPIRHRHHARSAGYLRLEQINEISEAEIEQLHGVGPKTIDQLRRALIAEGLSFAVDTRSLDSVRPLTSRDTLSMTTALQPINGR